MGYCARLSNFKKGQFSLFATDNQSHQCTVTFCDRYYHLTSLSSLSLLLSVLVPLKQSVYNVYLFKLYSYTIINLPLTICFCFSLNSWCENK